MDITPHAVILSQSRLFHAICARGCADAGVLAVPAASAGRALDLAARFEVKVAITAVGVQAPDAGVLLAGAAHLPGGRPMIIGVGSEAARREVGVSPDVWVDRDEDASEQLTAILRERFGAREAGELFGRVLVADDDAMASRLIEKRLRSAGAFVRTVGGGAAALSVLMREPFDLVVMDVEMPGFDGREAVRVLRALGLGVPVLASTAHEGFEAEAESHGFDAVVYKSTDASALVAACRAYVPGVRGLVDDDCAA